MSGLAIITGGAHGIGQACALEMAAAGYDVVVIDRDGDGASACADAVRAAGGTAHALVMDLSDREALTGLPERLAQLGTPAILVNNAGMTRAATLADTDWALWDDHFALNVDASFACVRAVAPAMVRAGYGRIVFVSSHSALRGSARRSAYAATKAAGLGLMRVLAVELAQHSITVNAVAPGPVETPHSARTHTAARRDAWHAALPIKRYASPEDVAAAVGFLASRRAGMITGQTLAVDGGFTIAGLMTNE